MKLDKQERAMLAGGRGPGAAYAMDLLCRYGEMVGARELVPIASAHIDSCLYHGPSGIDFAEGLRNKGARVSVPTTLNVAALDTVHPDVYRGQAELSARQMKLTDSYVAMGCLPTLTCAPYQRLSRPSPGQHVAWAESNAIVFANSVLGARTDRYGDFVDICAAVAGRVPLSGLHLDENRQPGAVVDVAPLGATGLERDIYFAAVGYALGELVAGQVPLLLGLPADTAEDDLKALGASAAAAGSVALFHVPGITPEAKGVAMQHGALPSGLAEFRIDEGRLRGVITELGRARQDEAVAAVCIGTPHFSLAEFKRLAALVEGRRSSVEFYVSTSRETLDLLRTEPFMRDLEDFGVTLIVDTCTYLAPVVRRAEGVILTNSAKWAHYGPSNLGRRAALLPLAACIDAAESGMIGSV